MKKDTKTIICSLFKLTKENRIFIQLNILFARNSSIFSYFMAQSVLFWVNILTFILYVELHCSSKVFSGVAILDLEMFMIITEYFQEKVYIWNIMNDIRNLYFMMFCTIQWNFILIAKFEF